MDMRKTRGTHIIMARKYKKKRHSLDAEKVRGVSFYFVLGYQRGMSLSRHFTEEAYNPKKEYCAYYRSYKAADYT